MKKKHLKPQVRIFLYVLLALAIAAAGFLLFAKKESHKAIAVGEKVTQVPVIEEVPPEPENPFEPVWSSSDWQANYAINDEYIGTFRFESGIIDLPVMLTDNNFKYLTLNWETMGYDADGTLYVDYNDTPDSMNITIYGHYCYPEVDAEQVRMFTPLHLLKEQENYEANQYIDLLLEHEARRYQVAAVYYVPLVFSPDSQSYDYAPDDLCYYVPEFSDEYFQSYISRVKQEEFYDTGVEFTNKDHLLTMQTCVYLREDLRLIVVAKEVERKAIE